MTTPTTLNLAGAIRSTKLVIAREAIRERQAVSHLQAKLEAEGDDAGRNRTAALDARQLALDAYEFSLREVEYLESLIRKASAITVPGPGSSQAVSSLAESPA